MVVLTGLGWNPDICRAQSPDNDVPGAQVLTRGPVHEAFAGMVAFNPEPGVVVTKAPPDVIEEVPPEERPEGDNVAWIPGYWAWDDERGNFLWVSGTWRALPPGREWMAGYWGETRQGSQWISGYWADTAVRETTYLPQPPATVEVGPNIAAPSIDYGWTPGCWVWYEGRYAWRPGYWAQGRADWDWTPAHYVWTPRGYIFVEGFWDYPVERRGILFAPVYFEAGVYSRRGYSYSPRIVINLAVFHDHLFLRPRYHHYYFGDYYAPSYHQSGFQASFSFHSSRHGYDPIYSHRRWEHRRDRNWERRVETSFTHRRDHEASRPPRTWTAQRNLNSNAAESGENPVLVAAPINQLAGRIDSPMRFRPVAREERQQLARRGQEVRQSRDQRRTLEAKSADPTAQRPGGVVEPAKVQLPRSPIVAKPANQLGRNRAPPEAQRAPRPNLRRQPESEASGRPPNVDRSNPPPEQRRPESVRSTPGRSEVAPRGRPVQPESVRPANNPAVDRNNPPPEQRRPEPVRSTPGRSEAAPRGRPVQPESVRPANNPAAKAQDESQSNARALEQKTRQDSERRSRDGAVKAREDSQRNVPVLEKKTQRVSDQPARKRPDASEKGASRLLLLRGDRQKPNKEKQSPPLNPTAP